MKNIFVYNGSGWRGKRPRFAQFACWYHRNDRFLISARGTLWCRDGGLIYIAFFLLSLQRSQLCRPVRHPGHGVEGQRTHWCIFSLTLIEAYCNENGIRLLQVLSPEEDLLNLVKPSRGDRHGRRQRRRGHGRRPPASLLFRYGKN